MEKNKPLLASEAFLQDVRIAEAKQLILSALKDHQEIFRGVRPPNLALKQTYDDLIRTFISLRGNSLYYPYLGSGFGKGALVELQDGSVKYDFISGIGVHYWGHSNPELISAALDAALSDTIMQGHLQQNIDSLKLSELLTRVSGLKHCFLASSGAMANENALKIALQRNFPANRILAFDHCFMGRTLALSQITDKPAYREGLPNTLQVDYIPFFDYRKPEESILKATETLKTFLKRYPKQHALMSFEFIQGEGGFYAGVKEFFLPLMNLLKENHVAILADEVQSFGRTSKLFAFQYFELDHYIDIATIGKLSQVCSTLFTADYQPRPGLLSQTFTCSTAAIKAAQVIIQHLVNDGYFGPQGKIEQIHQRFEEKLNKLHHQYPRLIEGPFGIGAMIAFTPWGGDAAKVAQFAQKLFDAGVIGFVAGAQPTRIRFLVPAGILTAEDIDKGMTIVESTLLKDF